MSALERAADLLARHIMDAAAGVVSSELGNEVRDALGLAALEMPPLDRECWQCQGAGVIPPPDGSTPWVPKDTCGCCHGHGHTLTDAGRELIAFLQRHPPVQLAAIASHPVNLTQVTPCDNCGGGPGSNPHESWCGTDDE